MKTLTILCDIHQTILTKEDKPIPDMVDFVKTLSEQHIIVLITARQIQSPQELEALKSVLQATDIDYQRVLTTYPDVVSDRDDADVKKDLIERNNVKPDIAIDNNKKCIKMYKEMEIKTLRFKDSV